MCELREKTAQFRLHLRGLYDTLVSVCVYEKGFRLRVRPSKITFKNVQVSLNHYSFEMLIYTIQFDFAL